MMLTDTERKRFADWLRRDAMSNRGLADAMSKLHPGAQIMEELIKRKRMLAIAEELVASELERAEQQTISQ